MSVCFGWRAKRNLLVSNYEPQLCVTNQKRVSRVFSCASRLPFYLRPFFLSRLFPLCSTNWSANQKKKIVNWKERLLYPPKSFPYSCASRALSRTFFSFSSLKMHLNRTSHKQRQKTLVFPNNRKLDIRARQIL